MDLIKVDSGVQIIPLFNLNTQNIMDAQSLQPLHGQRRWQIWNEHVVLGKRVKDVLRNDTITLIVERMSAQILIDESTGFFLEGEMRCGIVWGREAAEVRRLGEWEWVGVAMISVWFSCTCSKSYKGDKEEEEETKEMNSYVYFKKPRRRGNLKAGACLWGSSTDGPRSGRIASTSPHARIGHLSICSFT